MRKCQSPPHAFLLFLLTLMRIHMPCYQTLSRTHFNTHRHRAEAFAFAFASASAFAASALASLSDSLRARAFLHVFHFRFDLHSLRFSLFCECLRRYDRLVVVPLRARKRANELLWFRINLRRRVLQIVLGMFNRCRRCLRAVFDRRQLIDLGCHGLLVRACSSW